MITSIKQNIFALEFLEFGSIAYLIKLNNQNILIDTSSKSNQEELIQDLEELEINPEDIDILILTHNHWDHIENKELFSKAKVYANKRDFKTNDILPIEELNIAEFQIIKTPGHTKGSFCILYDKVLFSGDTIFHQGIGRTDFPESSPTEMVKSLEKIKKLEFEILCPGH